MTRGYLDTSAFLKLVVAEDHSAAMVEHFNGNEYWSSELLGVEASRVALRLGLNVNAFDPVLARVGLSFPSLTTFVSARLVGSATLRSLDALHLAAALEMRPDVTVFATYDRRLGRDARAAGFAVVAPGLPDGWLDD